MLFTDGPLCDSSELTRYDSGVQDVANSEGIDLSAKIAVAQEEIGTRLLLFLRNNGAERLGLFHVVATIPLRRWLILKTLAAVYRDAYYSQLNDRYQGKWTEYEGLADAAWQVCSGYGVGVVRRPIPRPAPPTLSAAAGSGAAAMYYVQTTWVSADGIEGAPSAVGVIETGVGSALEVSAGTAPSVAVGWNVYAGPSMQNCGRQNAAPLAPSAVWTMPSGGLENSVQAAAGQDPEFHIRIKRILQRG